MVYPDRVVPVVRSRAAARVRPRGAREHPARLNAASAALSTLALRGLNQSVIDGRLPEAVGGEFVDANGLSAAARRAARPADRRRLHGLRRERDARAPLRRGAARGRLPRARAQRRRAAPGGGARLRATRSTSIPPTTARCCATWSAPPRRGCRPGCARTLARIDAEPMRLSRAQDRNVFVMKTEAASRLGITKLSDLARYWQTA